MTSESEYQTTFEFSGWRIRFCKDSGRLSGTTTADLVVTDAERREADFILSKWFVSCFYMPFAEELVFNLLIDSF